MSSRFHPSFWSKLSVLCVFALSCQAAPVCELQTLTISDDLTLVPAFTPVIDSYTVTLPHTTRTLHLTPTLDTGSLFLSTSSLGWKAYNNSDLPPINVIDDETVVKMFIKNRDSEGQECEKLVTVNLMHTYVTEPPRLVGINGQGYSLPLIDGKIYNIWSDKSLQINGIFTHAITSTCIKVRVAGELVCHAHRGGFMKELTLQTVHDKIHIQSSTRATGLLVTINNEPIEFNQAVALNEEGGFIVCNAFICQLKYEGVEMEIGNRDEFLGYKIHVEDTSDLTSHGLIGQTWKYTNTAPDYIIHVEGFISDYESDDLWEVDFPMYNRFQREEEEEEVEDAVKSMIVATSTGTRLFHSI